MRYFVVLPFVVALCGCHVKAGLDKGATTKEVKKEDAPAPVVVQKEAPAAPAGDGKGIIGKMTDEVVDYQKAKAENPNLIEVETRASGSDYLTFLSSAYINVRSQVSMLGMQQELNMIKQVEGRNPTYDEIIKIMKQYKIQFTMLPHYQMYSYDAKGGRFVVLEDPAKHTKE